VNDSGYASSPQALSPRSLRWDERVAVGVSYVVSPVILPPLLFGAVLVHVGAPTGEAMWAAGVALLFFSLIPLGYVMRQVQLRRTSSVEVPERLNRTRPFFVGIASTLAAVIVLFVTSESSGLAVALGLFHALNLVMIMLVNLRWKISVHMASLAGVASMLLVVSWLVEPALPTYPFATLRIVWILVLLIPVLAWARVRTGAHTRLQVVAGTSFGLFIPALQAYLLFALGLLGSPT
jgi:hypothetical protein